MLARLRRSLGGRGRRAMFAALIGLVLLSGVSTVALLRARKASAAITPYNTKLLMIHGFDDWCASAFDDSRYIAGATRNTTLNFFTSNGWDRSSIRRVGYYTDLGHPDQSTCNVDIADSDSDGKYFAGLDTNDSHDYSHGKCDTFFQQAPNAPDPYVRQNKRGTTSDPIRHLGCLLAWYIWDLNQSGSPVVIVAHSMGGLIVRDALGESGQTDSFPGPLDVRQVVTVGTPHGGEGGWYLQLAHVRFAPNPVPREVWDMDPGSSGSGFMSMLTGEQFQHPRGSNNAQWILIAGSVAGRSAEISPINTCFSQFTDTTLLNCAVEVGHENDPYPDGDGVVQADSALSMKADFKILYGHVTHCVSPDPTPSDPYPVPYCESPYSPGETVDYSHEANTCLPLPDALPGGNPCLVPEFLLNDASLGSTYAWVCPSACNAGASGVGGIADLHVDDSSNPNVRSVLHSLEEILSFLPAPLPPPSTPTSTSVPTCITTTETDNLEEAAHGDLRDNFWHVYYDIKRDAVDNVACEMRMTPRIYPPIPGWRMEWNCQDLCHHGCQHRVVGDT